MSTHNIYFHDKIGKHPKISLDICFLELSEEFPRVRISHGKRAILVRAIEVTLYMFYTHRVLLPHLCKITMKHI